MRISQKPELAPFLWGCYGQILGFRPGGYAQVAIHFWGCTEPFYLDAKDLRRLEPNEEASVNYLSCHKDDFSDLTLAGKALTDARKRFRELAQATGFRTSQVAVDYLRGHWQQQRREVTAEVRDQIAQAYEETARIYRHFLDVQQAAGL